MTQLWAEIGLTHGGSIDAAAILARRVARAGAHTLKVQVHHPAEGDETETGRAGTPRGDLWARTAFTREQWGGLVEYAHSCGLKVVASVFCPQAVDLVAGLVDGWKIPSGQVINGPLWHRLAATRQPVAVSGGMRDRTVYEAPIPRDRVTLLHCVSSYPCRLSDMGWERFTNMRGWRGDFGLSDHSGTVWPALMAASQGAHVVEVHVKEDDAIGPDADSSLTFQQLAFLAEAFKAIYEVRSSGPWQPAVDLRPVYEPRWFPEEGVMRKSTKGLPPETWWEGR